MSLAIDVRGLNKSFGDKHVVQDVSLQVEEGRICGFLGPNGSGKTTTLRMLCGLLTPDSGEGTCLGLDIITQANAIKRRAGYMTQRFSLYEDLTIEENLQISARVHGLNHRKDRVDQAQERLGLVERRGQLAGSLSGGWKQRLALATATLHEPQLLLLDEPTAGVDPKARREFWDEIHLLAAGGLTVLVSTHYMDEAERCHRINYIAYGRLVASGTTQEVIDYLEANGIRSERKTVYTDMEELEDFGLDIIRVKERPGGYYLASRKFELAELKLLVDAVQASKFITTKKSRELIAKLVAGQQLPISKIMVGSGTIPDDVKPAAMTALVEPVAAGTSTAPVYDGASVRMIVEYRSDLNGGLDHGFWLREFGVFAFDPDKGEVLIYYGTLGDYPQYVSAASNTGVDVRKTQRDFQTGERDFILQLIELLQRPTTVGITHQHIDLRFVLRHD